MATNPKMLPCPQCGNDAVAVYGYDNGMKHVECDRCHYLGPGEGSNRQAIKSHNEKCRSEPLRQGQPSKGGS